MMEKPTLKIAILREPGTEARQLFRSLRATPWSQTENPWWAKVEGDKVNFDFFVGMPPRGTVHGALVFLDALQKPSPAFLKLVTQLSKKISGVMLGLLCLPFYFENELNAEELELLDEEEKTAREFFTACGLPGDELPIFRETLPEFSYREDLLLFIEERVSFFALDESIDTSDESRLWKFIRKAVFGKNFDNNLWASLRRGELSTEAHSEWRIQCIVHRAIGGDFEEAPELYESFRSWALFPSVATYAEVSAMNFIEENKRLAGDFSLTSEFRLLCSLGVFYLESALWFMRVLAQIVESNRFGPGLSEEYYLGSEAYCRQLQRSLHRLLGYLQRELEPIEVGYWRDRRAAGEYEANREERRDRWRAFINVAKSRYQELVTQIGPRELVWYGEKFSVRRAAERFWSEEIPATSSGDWLRMLLVQTGRVLNTENLNDWLLSEEATKYQEGVRYFYGHPIPAD
jgi:hypothetical protein